MKKKVVLLILAWVLLSLLFHISFNLQATRSTNVIWVPDDYPTIQGAINHANLGDTIKVRAETYYENVIVNKTVRLIGEGLPTIDGCLRSGMWGYPTVRVIAENVTICGFIIQHSLAVMNEMDFGIEADYGVNITGNIIRSNMDGIRVRRDAIVSNNTIECNGDGISCSGTGNILIRNTISFNGDGVIIWEPLNSLINNSIIGNYRYGIFLKHGDITLKNNNLTGNNYNLLVHGAGLSGFINDIDTSNIINEKPIYYWISQFNKTIPPDAGYVALINSTNITVKDLNLEKNGQGILIAYSNNITIRNSNISSNDMVINLYVSSNITFYHNNFINYTWIGDPYAPAMPPNTWDDSYPSGGNYWSGYAGADFYSVPYQNETGSDGIGDTPYVIDKNNQDNYPLIAPIKSFSVPWEEKTYYVDMISNSTISDFYFSQQNKLVGLNVTGPNNTTGFCRVSIPKTLLWAEPKENWTILLNNQNITSLCRTTEDQNQTYIYVPYNHTVHTLQIIGTHAIPEFPNPLILPILIATTLVAITIRKKRFHA